MNPRGQPGSSEPERSYVGGLLSEQPVLIRSPAVIAYVTNVRAYPEGILFSVFVAGRSDDYDPHETAPEVKVQFPDGRSWEDNPNMRGDCLIPTRNESSGGPGAFESQTDYWLPALPSSGAVSFYAAALSSSGTAVVDGDAIIAASRRAENLWDEQRH